MCSSSADSTPVAMGPLTTSDRTAVSDPLTVRSDDSTDISAKGLLPQLIDLLHALTQGQEMLSRKVRDAGLEYTRRPTTLDGMWAHTEPSDSAIPDTVGDAPPKRTIDVSAAPLSATAPPATSPSRPPGVVATPPATPADPPVTWTRATRHDSVMPGGETAQRHRSATTTSSTSSMHDWLICKIRQAHPEVCDLHERSRREGTANLPAPSHFSILLNSRSLPSSRTSHP